MAFTSAQCVPICGYPQGRHGVLDVLFRIDGAQTVYALAGIAIFSGYTLVDFNRLRRSGQDQAIQLAAGIFLDVFNLFLLFLQLFGGNRN